MSVRGILGVGVVLVVAALAGCSGDRNAPSPSPPDRTTSTTTTTTETAASRPHEPTIVETGFSEYYTTDQTYLAWAVVLDNPNADWVATEVRLDLTFSRDGHVLARVHETIPLVLPGKMAWAQQQTSGGLNPGPRIHDVDTLEVVVNVGEWRHLVEPGGTLTVGEVTMMPETVGIEVTAPVTSTWSSDLHRAVAVVVFRDARGTLLGGARTMVPVIPAGETTEVTVEEWEDLRGVAAARLFVSPTTLPK